MMTQFFGNLSTTVEPGHIFVIGGRTIEGAADLKVNLASGKTDEANQALHLSVRFYEDIIVRNSKYDNAWGAEERDENLDEYAVHNPLVAGDNFQFYIFVGDNAFHIAVNGRKYCDFHFRCPLEDIRTITVHQDVQLINQVDHRQAYPSPYPPIQSDDRKNVFSNDVPKPFLPGHVIVITALPFGNPKGMFTLRFTEGDTKKQALHFNVRFHPHNLVVRNSMNDALDFLKEERNGGFPFVMDQQFKLAIALTNNEFRFAVNGQYFTAFKYRSERLLEIMNGFKVTCGNGLQLEVSGVDHLNIGQPECEGFETYSDPEIHLL